MHTATDRLHRVHEINKHISCYQRDAGTAISNFDVSTKSPKCVIHVINAFVGARERGTLPTNFSSQEHACRVVLFV